MEHGLHVGGEAATGLSFSDDAARLHEDSSTTEHRISIHEALSHCCRICQEEDTQDNLIELRCNCQGDLSRAHEVCILRWFGVRMWLKRNYTCDLCTAPLHSIEQMVNLAMAEDEGRKILFEAIGAAMDTPRRTSTQVLEGGPIIEENTLQRVQPRQLSTVSRFPNSNSPCAGIGCLCVIVVVIWFYWIVSQLIRRFSSN